MVPNFFFLCPDIFFGISLSAFCYVTLSHSVKYPFNALKWSLEKNASLNEFPSQYGRQNNRFFLVCLAKFCSLSFNALSPNLQLWRPSCTKSHSFWSFRPVSNIFYVLKYRLIFVLSVLGTRTVKCSAFPYSYLNRRLVAILDWKMILIFLPHSKHSLMV